MSLIAGKENTFKIDMLIYELGDEVDSIAYIKQGSVRLECDGDESVVTAGNFIAVRDLIDGFYKYDYYAEEGSILMAFPAEDLPSFVGFLEANPAVHSLYYDGICSMMEFLYEQYSTLYSEIGNIYSLLTDIYERYIHCCQVAGVEPAQFMMPHNASLYSFEKQGFSQNYTVFLNCHKSPKKLKLLYEKNPSNFLRQQINMIESITTTYEDMVYFLKTTVSLFAGKSQDCLFFLVSSLMERVPSEYSGMIMSLLNDMKDTISQTDEHIKQTTGITLDIDYNRVNFYFMMASGAKNADSSASLSSEESLRSENDRAVNAYSDNSVNDLLTALNTGGIPSVPENSNISENIIKTDNIFSDEINDIINTDNLMMNEETSQDFNDADFTKNLYRLCEYGKKEHDFSDRLNSLVEEYMSMSDRASREDSARALRRELSNMYFELYEAVFFSYVTDDNPLPAARLFLDFGVLDERLLTDGQLKYIASIPPLIDTEPCRVYRMSDWLTAIYNGEKMPSKNEFDKDYTEFVREKKREEHLSPAQEKQLLDDRDAKVKYEINNLLKYNCRILNGNMLTFTPMLSSDDFEGIPDKYTLNSEIINGAVKSVLETDYSAFYREQMYADIDKKIEKEVIQLQVFPDIIIFPVYGINTVMWQDLSGKRSNTKGRFLFPAFYRGDINNAMITTVGRFRWELCKSVMGTAWNNVIIPSLTAEYSDYIQFYRKNRDLSADKKEALKNQISRCRNNTREVFIADYFMWIKYESTGAIRLNKVSRQILATYCPFAKAIREKVSGQPIYEDAMKRFNINHQKKIHEMAMRMRALERNGATITQEIYDTQEFYTL